MKQHLRVSVTELEGLRYCLQSDYVSWEEVRQRLRRVKTPRTEKQELGVAFHRALDEATLSVLRNDSIDASSCEQLEVDGYTFNFNRCLQPAVIVAPQATEVKIEERFDTSHGVQVTLVGKADGINGDEVIDHKLTFSPVDIESYAASIQWVCYLEMFKKKQFRYYFYEGKKKGNCNHVDIERVSQFAITGGDDLRGEVATAVDEYVYYVHKYAPERITYSEE